MSYGPVHKTEECGGHFHRFCFRHNVHYHHCVTHGKFTTETKRYRSLRHVGKFWPCLPRCCCLWDPPLHCQSLLMRDSGEWLLHWTTSIELQTLNYKRWTTSIELQALNYKLWTASFELQALNYNGQHFLDGYYILDLKLNLTAKSYGVNHSLQHKPCFVRDNALHFQNDIF